MMPDYPYPIRLRGPWECEPVARWIGGADGSTVYETDHLPPAGRVRVPGEWSEALGPGFRGRVRFRRRFHAPTGLEAHERLMLVIEGIDPSGDVQLNGRHLGRVESMEETKTFDVTGLVAANNELVIEVEFTGHDADPVLGRTPDHPTRVGGSGDQPTTGGDQPTTGGRLGEVRL